MASFLTSQAQIVSDINAVTDLVATGQPGCIDEAMVFLQASVLASFPDLKLKPMPYGDLTAALKTGDCKGVIVDHAQLALWMVNEENCHVRDTRDRLLSGAAGWVAQMDSFCLEGAINYALHVADLEGFVQKEYLKWLTPATCPSLDLSDSEDLSLGVDVRGTPYMPTSAPLSCVFAGHGWPVPHIHPRYYCVLHCESSKKEILSS